MYRDGKLVKMIAMKSTEVQNPRRDFYGSREGHRFELGVWSLEFGAWSLALGLAKI